MHHDQIPPGENFDGTPSNPVREISEQIRKAQPAGRMSPQPQTPAPSTAKLAEALAKAQGEIKAPLKRRKVDFTNKTGVRVKYNYADLADVIECIREPLAKNGLSITHQLEYLDSGRGAWYGLTTRLNHASGEYLTCWYPLPDPVDKEIKAQEFGSALTYARRYSLSSLLGIASEEDDDAEEAAPAGNVSQPRPATSAPKPAPIPSPRTAAAQGGVGPQHSAGGVTEPQLKRLFTIATASKWTHEQVKLYIEARWKISSSKELTRSQYDDLVSTIETMDYPKAVLYAAK